MTVKTDHLGTGAFLKSEGPGHISRDTITVKSGAGVVLAGTVLGKLTADSKYVPYDNDAATGEEVADAILLADVDATSADVQAVGIVRVAEVWTDRLIWGAAVTTEGEKTAALADLAANLVIAR